MIKFEYSYFDLPEYFYTKLFPEAVSQPEMVIFNSRLAEQLGLDPSDLSLKPELFSGNVQFENAQTFSQAYAGHQFGNFNILGDGRAHIIGELRDSQNHLWDVQLKGSGRTPYSRRGDGRAALAPMLREYILSEAMYGLGVPSTRSLAVVRTGDKIYRETALPGAILTRIASSHIRVGTFEWAFVKGNYDGVRALADYAINRHYLDLKNDPEKYIKFLERVITKQALLISKWMNVGFIHGVMNTDNMTISGETIDYGPCAFMDEYDPQATFSSIDHNARYAYGNQPAIAHWNLVRLAETMLCLFDENIETAKLKAEKLLEQYKEIFKGFYYQGLRNKFGLTSTSNSDQELFQEFFAMMAMHQADYTWTFDQISRKDNPVEDVFETSEFKQWKKLWLNRIAVEQSTLHEAQSIMKKSNPVFVARNFFVEEALKEASENSNFIPMKRLTEALQNPFEECALTEMFRERIKGHSKSYQTFCGT